MTAWCGKTVFISGGGSGIGLAIVKHALQQGAKVSTLIRSTSGDLDDLVADNLLICQGDIANREQVNQWHQLTIEKFNTIDIVINNAGCMYYMSMDNADYQQMQNMVMTNCMGMINLFDACLVHLSKQQPCHWINLSSDAGRTAFAGLAVYSGTKAFIEFTTKAMRQELTDYRFKMTNIQPGNVKTSLHNKSTKEDAVKLYGSEDNGQYLSSKDIVAAIDYAITSPFDVAINEILLQPRIESI